MASAILTILDGESVARDLEALPLKMARQIGHEALREGGEPMVAAIRARIHSRTGLLAGGLKIRNAKGDRPGRIAVLITSTTSREKFAAAQSSGVAKRVRLAGQSSDRYAVYYGLNVEFGHANVRGGGDVPPHPFLLPGFDTTVESVLDTAEQKVGESLDAVWTNDDF